MIPVLWIMNIAFILLMIFGMVALFRLIYGPTAPDRVVGLDAMTTITVAAMILYGTITAQVVMIDVALVYAILSFVATIYVARYIEEKKEEM